ncbi:MAG: tripartite tricarboxylate transporter substrate-binding protein [Xanthobacteraceae bacterium]
MQDDGRCRHDPRPLPQRGARASQVQMMFGVMPASLGYIRAGKLRALAVTSAKRQEILPDAPALNEFFPGYEANGWYGIGAPFCSKLRLNRPARAAT